MLESVSVALQVEPVCCPSSETDIESICPFRVEDEAAACSSSAALTGLRSAVNSFDSPDEQLLEQVTRKHL